MTTRTTQNANAFSSTLYFFSTHKANAEKNKKSLQANAPRHLTIMDGQNTTEKEHRTANSGFNKLAVQWLNEVLCFVSSSVLADSFVPRNRQLLKPAKRYS